jgi:hypothetical protein
VASRFRSQSSYTRILHSSGKKVYKSQEVHCEADLTADARAREILASEQAEAEAQPFADDIVSPAIAGSCDFARFPLAA